jgi:tetraacyldisaccharide 4'-kinase
MPNLKNIVSEMLRNDRNSWCLFPLFLISILYSGIIRLRNLFYQTGLFKVRKLGCRVVSVGNITVGGTGKTPMVIMLANLLKEKGYRPAILSRGYRGKKKRRVNVVSDGKNLLMGPEKAGDEPALIAKSVSNIPVVTGKKRYLTGKFAIEHFGADVLILDDAFQHRSLFRNIDIVLLDEKRPFGNGFVIPRGELREPANELGRADIIVKTGIWGRGPEDRKQGSGISEQVAMNRGEWSEVWGQQAVASVYRAYRRPKDLLKADTEDVYPLAYLNGKKICAFAGIARPDSFKKTIASVGGEVITFLSFPDHHVYTREDLDKLMRTVSESSAQIILTTEKDGIKLIDFPDFLRDIYQLRIEMEILPSQKKFEDILLERIKT